MTKQEDVVSFKRTPKGGLELEKREEEKETPKDEIKEVKSELSVQKLGSSNRSFAAVLGALSAMIIGGALATYSVSFEYALYLHEKVVSYFPWSWLQSYTDSSNATLYLALVAVAVSVILIVSGVMILNRKKTIRTVPATDGTKDEAVVTTATDPQPQNEYESWSFDDLVAELNRSEADIASWSKYAKEGRQKSSNIRSELSKRVLSLKIPLPKEPVAPKSRKNTNSGKERTKDFEQVLDEQSEMEEQKA